MVDKKIFEAGEDNQVMNSLKFAVDVAKTILWWCSIIPPLIAVVKGTFNGVSGEIKDVIKKRNGGKKDEKI